MQTLLRDRSNTHGSYKQGLQVYNTLFKNTISTYSEDLTTYKIHPELAIYSDWNKYVYIDLTKGYLVLKLGRLLDNVNTMKYFITHFEDIIGYVLIARDDNSHNISTILQKVQSFINNFFETTYSEKAKHTRLLFSEKIFVHYCKTVINKPSLSSYISTLSMMIIRGLYHYDKLTLSRKVL